MNQQFDFRRFILLVNKHWADNRKRYVLSILAFIGLLTAWYLFLLLVEAQEPMNNGVQMITYFFALFAVGTFYASQYFNELGTRPKGINFLLVPASALEKMLCGLLFGVLLFFVVFTACFYLVDISIIAIINSLWHVDVKVINVFDIAFLRFNSDSSVNLLLAFFAVQAAFLLGSIYFEKYSFIKTCIFGFVGCFSLFCLMYMFYSLLLPKGDYHNGFFTSYRVVNDGVNQQLVQVPRWMGDTFVIIAMYVVAPFLWVVTYYRLKEKQV